MLENQTIAGALFEIGAVRFGRFTLHSGAISPIYLDLRLLASYPAVLRQVAQAYAALLSPLAFDVLAAIPYAGLPIGTAIALAMDRPLVFPRKQAKSFGVGKSVEGWWNVGDRAVIIEDLVTSGDSVLEGIAVLEAAGLQVRDVVVLIDRQQGGQAALAARGYRLHAVMTLTQLLSELEEQGRITPEQRRQVLQALSL